MKLIKLFAAIAIAATLSACASTQQNIQQAADRNVLNYTVGKSYAKIAATNATTPEGMFGQEKAYGNLVGQTLLANGDTVYKHAAKREAAQSSVDFGLIGGTNKRIDYGLLYFRVGPDGIIRDTANGVITGETVDCMDYVGGLFQTCNNAEQLSRDIAQMDAVVKTSGGQPYSSWR